jgi:hypothetical protein
MFVVDNVYICKIKRHCTDFVSVNVYHPDGTLLTRELCRGFDRAQELAGQAQRIRHLSDDEFNLTIDCRGV